jgi:hypothetical protein
MFHFNKKFEEQLKDIFDNSSMFNLIIIWGEKGVGKTFLSQSFLQLNDIKYKNIIFSDENVLPFGFNDEINFLLNDENAILMQCSELFAEDYCLYFENMECSDLDSQRILFELIKYYKNHDKKANIILEYNITVKPDNKICLLANHFFHIDIPDNTVFEKYYKNYFCDSNESKELFKQILLLSRKNIQNFFAIQKILLSMHVLEKKDGLLMYNDTNTYKLPSNIEDLYIDTFGMQKKYIQNLLVSAAPFSKQIYDAIIYAIYNDYDRLDEYLDKLSKQGYFIHTNNNRYNKNYRYFKSNYAFSGEYARKTILGIISPPEINEVIIKYNNYLDKLFCNKSVYNNLQNTEKIMLLSMLTKKRHKQLTFSQIQYITELMEYYYKSFMYLNAIKQGKKLLESKVADNLRLNKESHQFWVIYFHSLLAIGNYKKIIDYKDEFEDEDLNYDIAVALYDSGRPLEALNLLEKMQNKAKYFKGHIHILKASIYDWLGDSKKSKIEFKRAILYSDDTTKYLIYKRYNMYIDFRIPECRKKMQCAIDYYKENNLKQYAECLHNYGTSCIFIKDYENAQKYLSLSVDILNKICANQIYYPLNSLAILYCYSEYDYSKATKTIWEALKCNIDETFCKLALHNNLFNIAINMKDYKSAYEERNVLENIINAECSNIGNIKNEHQDIQHQLRQFYYNCALLFKSENNLSAALEYFKCADKSSKYTSNIVYSIKRNISDLNRKSINSRFLDNIKNKHKPAPTELELYIYERDLYLCEIMFWG